MTTLGDDISYCVVDKCNEKKNDKMTLNQSEVYIIINEVNLPAANIASTGDNCPLSFLSLVSNKVLA